MVTPISYFPAPVNFDNYILAWKDSRFALYFWNTLIIAAGTLLLVSLVSVMAAMRFRAIALRGGSFLPCAAAHDTDGARHIAVGATLCHCTKPGLINSLSSVCVATSASRWPTVPF
jgi:ABC-type glycerol-3-phosphate transport system permease component